MLYILAYLLFVFMFASILFRSKKIPKSKIVQRIKSFRYLERTIQTKEDVSVLKITKLPLIKDKK